MKPKKIVFLIFIIILTTISLKGCIIHEGMDFTIVMWKEYGNNTLDSANDKSKECVVNGVSIKPEIVPDIHGNYVAELLIYTKEKDEKLIVKEAYMKTHDGKNLINEPDLNLSISADIKIKDGYRGLDIISKFPKESVEKDMKLFLLLVVEENFGESKKVMYVINATKRLYPSF